MRTNYIVVFIICQFVNIGMWFERFVIIVTSLARTSCRVRGAITTPTWVEIWTFIGTFGMFLSLFLLFMRFLPMIAITEVKAVTPEADPHHDPRRRRRSARRQPNPRRTKEAPLTSHGGISQSLWPRGGVRQRC